jgi:hypothetical protein
MLKVVIGTLIAHTNKLGKTVVNFTILVNLQKGGEKSATKMKTS